MNRLFAVRKADERKAESRNALPIINKLMAVDPSKPPAPAPIFTSLKRIGGAGFSNITGAPGSFTLVTFLSSGCKPCRLLAAELETLAEDYEPKVSFYAVDVNEEPLLSEHLGIISTPTIIFFADGKPAFRLLGYETSHDIRLKIDAALKTNS